MKKVIVMMLLMGIMLIGNAAGELEIFS
ncbi:hypothetical protein C7380_11379, partial [Oceanotoga teriensis]